MPRQEDMSQKVVGSNPNAGKGLFLTESLSKCACTFHGICKVYKYELHSVLFVSLENEADLSQIRIKTFKKLAKTI